MAQRLILAPWTQQPQESATPKSTIDGAPVAWLWEFPQGSSNSSLLNLIDGSRAASQDGNNEFASQPTPFGVAGRNTAGTDASALRYQASTTALSGATGLTLCIWFQFRSTDTSSQWLNFRTDFQHTLDVFSQTSSSVTWGADWAGAWNGASPQTLSGLVDGQFVCLGASITEAGARFWANGQFSGTKSGSSFTTSSSVLSIASATRSRQIGALALRGWLSDARMQALTTNPWAEIYEPQRVFVKRATGGATTHAATGALAAQAAALSGTATRFRQHAASGTLTAQAAAIAGTGARSGATVTHPSTGALAASAASIAGTAKRFAVHASTGALLASPALLAGTANRVITHAATGSLVASPAAISGVASRPVTHAATGSLVSGVASIYGLGSIGAVSGTIRLPRLEDSKTGQEVTIHSVLALSGVIFEASGATISGAPATIEAGGSATLRFDRPTLTWHRV